MKTRITALLTAALLAVGLIAAPAAAHDGDHEETGQRGQALGRIAPGIGAELAAARAATARYHDVEVAMEDGYVNTMRCVASPAGAMGIHFVNFDLVGGTLDPTQPQALLYLPGPNGQLRLVGVEYIDFSGQGALFGQGFTDAVPNPDPEIDGVIPNAALHVWLWQANPAGMFAAFNPNLSCPPVPDAEPAD